MKFPRISTFAIISSLTFFLFGTLNAQILERGGSLGSYIHPNEEGEGIRIGKVLPDGTAEQIGLKENDILFSVNGTTVNSVPQIVAMTRTWRENDDLKVTLIREQDMMMNIEGKVKGKPKESSTHGQVIYGSVPYEQGQLRSILNLPEGIANPPVVFYIQGYSCYSIDFYYNEKDPLRQWVEDLVEKGFAVFRMEKPGMGDSENTGNCTSIGYNEEVAAFTAGLRTLKEHESIDSNNIFLFGHSLGGITAPLMASQEKVRGIINYGSVSTSWYEYLIKVLREQEVTTGSPNFMEIEQNTRARIPLLHDYLVKKLSLDELLNKPGYEELMSSGLPLWDGKLFIGRNFSFMPEVNDANLTEALAKSACPVLAISGEYDIAVVDSEWAGQVAEIVNHFHPGFGSSLILPKTQHSFIKVPSMEEYVQLRNENLFNNAYMSEHYNPALVEEMSKWINKVKNNS
jgi:pimeloyl-ACP methyl ester carboxylesterase